MLAASSSLLLPRGNLALRSSFPTATRRGGGRAAAVVPLRAAASSEGANEEDKPKKRRHHHHHGRPKPKPKPATGGAVNRPVAYLPPHKLSLTPEERAAPPPTPVERGRDEVAALCAVLPEGSEDRAECEDALQYYDRLAGGDGEACSLAAAMAAGEGGGGGEGGGEGTEGAAEPSASSSSHSSSSRFADPACADEKERFESFVRELLYANSVSGFVKALGRRKREEERRREKEAAAGGGGGSAGGAAAPSSSSSSPSPAVIDAETERRRAGLVALFRRYDRDGNGRLDAAEFREAAAAAGDPLTGSEVAKIFTALDIHGAGVSLDDFLAAVEAEDFMKPASPLAAWLRAHAGGGSVGELPGVDQLL